MMARKQSEKVFFFTLLFFLPSPGGERKRPRRGGGRALFSRPLAVSFAAMPSGEEIAAPSSKSGAKAATGDERERATPLSLSPSLLSLYSVAAGACSSVATKAILRE